MKATTAKRKMKRTPQTLGQLAEILTKDVKKALESGREYRTEELDKLFRPLCKEYGWSSIALEVPLTNKGVLIETYKGTGFTYRLAKRGEKIQSRFITN